MKTIITFLKNWTLPSAIVAGTVIYLIFYWVPALDPISEVMAPIFDTILPLFMSLILFTTFLVGVPGGVCRAHHGPHHRF